MGKTKSKNGDGHIVFHVGEELSVEGSDILLVPGVQNAQERGVYFSEVPQLKYSGGEHFKKTMEITPIYYVPLAGAWQKGILKKEGQYGGVSHQRKDHCPQRFTTRRHRATG